MKLPRKSESTKISRYCEECTERYPRPCLEGAKWDLSLSGFLCSSCEIF